MNTGTIREPVYDVGGLSPEDIQEWPSQCQYKVSAESGKANSRLFQFSENPDIISGEKTFLTCLK